MKELLWKLKEGMGEFSLLKKKKCHCTKTALYNVRWCFHSVRKVNTKTLMALKEIIKIYFKK
jgi:hypothetical protein